MTWCEGKAMSSKNAELCDLILSDFKKAVWGWCSNSNTSFMSSETTFVTGSQNKYFPLYSQLMEIILTSPKWHSLIAHTLQWPPNSFSLSCTFLQSKLCKNIFDETFPTVVLLSVDQRRGKLYIEIVFIPGLVWLCEPCCSKKGTSVASPLGCGVNFLGSSSLDWKKNTGFSPSSI